MKNLKYVIIALVIIIVIMVVVIISLNKNGQDTEPVEDENIPQDTLVTFDKKTVKESDDNLFFTINDIIQKEVSKKQNDVTYYAQEMYKIQDYQYCDYYTYGLIKAENSQTLADYYLKVSIDYTNNTFLTEDISIEEFQKAKRGEITQINQKPITKTDDNSYDIGVFTSNGIASRYIKDYIVKAQLQTAKAYELLEDSYKGKFTSVDDLKKYIQTNSERFSNFEIKTCQCQVKENLLEYTVFDQNDNYYKIMVYSALNYKIILEN